MFSGIVKECGRVVGIDKRNGIWEIVLSCDSVFEGKKIGDSIAVNGVCLTVVELDGDRISFQVIQETLDLTNLKYLEIGDLVNLEGALRLADTIDGHLVQGHVDGVAEIVRIESEGDVVWYWLRSPQKFSRFIAYKGSVCLNGVSLTVAGLEGDVFGVSLIPHTLQITNLGGLKVGDLVNLEVDMIARYLDRLYEK